MSDKPTEMELLNERIRVMSAPDQLRLAAGLIEGAFAQPTNARYSSIGIAKAIVERVSVSLGVILALKPKEGG